MLDRIDLHGTLEPSWEGMPQLLGQSDSLLAMAVDGGEREVLEAVYRLGERCRDDQSLGFAAGRRLTTPATPFPSCAYVVAQLDN